MESITKEDVIKTVKITKKGATVQSDKVAKVFGKAHKNLLKQIDKEIEFLTASNIAVKTYFIDDNYVNSRGKVYKRYQMTRKGFDYIVLGWTGKKAKLYKIWYIDEFHKKSEVISQNKQFAYENNENPLWLEFREQGKDMRTKLTDAINDYLLPQREEENKETAQFVSRYITSYTKLIYKTLGIEVPKGTTLNRDAMNLRVLFNIESIEEKVSIMIKNCTNNGVHYKDTYKAIKEKMINPTAFDLENEDSLVAFNH